MEAPTTGERKTPEKLAAEVRETTRVRSVGVHRSATLPAKVVTAVQPKRPARKRKVSCAPMLGARADAEGCLRLGGDGGVLCRGPSSHETRAKYEEGGAKFAPKGPVPRVQLVGFFKLDNYKFGIVSFAGCLTLGCLVRRQRRMSRGFFRILVPKRNQ
jgi:hypothetical protein